MRNAGTIGAEAPRRADGAHEPALRRYWKQYWVTVCFYATVSLIWELLSGHVPQRWRIPSYILPAPSAIYQEMVRVLPILLAHTRTTLVEILLGFLVGAVIGFGSAILVVYSRVMERIIYPMALFTQTIPKLAIAPLFLIWFGFGLAPKVAITALICLFPVLINSVAGLVSVDPKMMDLMYVLSATRWQVFRKIRLPSAVPHIFAGLEIGISLATVGAIVAEWVGAESGLGYMILIANNQLRTERVFAAIVAIVVLGLALFVGMRGLEHLVSPRRPAVEASKESL